MFFLTIRAQSAMPFPWADTLGCRRSVRKSRRNGSLFIWMYSKACFRLCSFTNLSLDQRTNSIFQNTGFAQALQLHRELPLGPLLHPSQAQTLQELLGFAYYQPCSRIWKASTNSPEIRSELSPSFQVHPKPELRPESPVSPVITAIREMVLGKIGGLSDRPSRRMSGHSDWPPEATLDAWINHQ